MREAQLAVVAGDGIGPEIMEAALQVFDKAVKRQNLSCTFTKLLAGGAALEVYGEPLPEATIKAAQGANAVLLGAVGDPKWDSVEPEKRPEKAILGLRKALGLYANLRPVEAAFSDEEASPLKKERLEGTDLIIVRELGGGIYYGERQEGDEFASDVEAYSVQEVNRILQLAAQIASRRRKKVTSVDKANVLATSRLWRKAANAVSEEYKDMQWEHMYVDNCAMQLVTNPSRFDVIVTSNLFGDILSDEAAVLTGSIGMMPSASLGAGPSLFEPIHGSAPDIAGQGVANPVGMILSAAFCAEMALEAPGVGGAIRDAVRRVWLQGYRTADTYRLGYTKVSTQELANRIEAELEG